MSNNILKHETDIWKTADLLIGAGIKQSDFPKFMMPFFALVMVESRLVREASRLEKEVGKDNIDDFIEMFRLEGLGYNEFAIREGKTLKTICKNDKTFDVDFYAYIRAFDPETRYLLGVDKGTDEEKFLDISGVAGLLKKKDVLFDTVKAWSEIDLTPFNNSEITTLEEHIKRKWADISAETAGEQYTPDDIISLISEIIAAKIDDNGKFLTIYDPTCGGGNLLFGVEDKIQEKFNRPTKTHGDEWNDALFALAKIESRFRNDSDINYGNTLTRIFHIEKRFDIVIANPPYGVDWKGYQKDIKNDTTERFVAVPSIDDGQFLFTQHILHHLADDGLSIVVHNGATLFSGSAGSNEDIIRRNLFDNDWVEAIIQLPTDEFFNTNIYTYLWIFNKNKPVDRKDKVALIDGSNHWEQLKKSKGKKRRQMNETNRADIVKAFMDFENNEFTKVFDKWHFYYNKQAIMLTNVDVNGNYIEMPTKTNRAGDIIEVKSIKLDPTKITYQIDSIDIEITDFVISDYEDENCNNLKEYYDKVIKQQLSKINYKESSLKIHTENAVYWFDIDKNTLIEEVDNKRTELGCGRINVKGSFKKATKTKDASIAISVDLSKDFEKDYEYTPFKPNPEDNLKLIQENIAQFVERPFELLDNKIGTEIYFNKLFFKPKPIFDFSLASENILELSKELKKLEEIISNSVLKHISKNSRLKESGIPFIGQVPVNWEVKRFKDLIKKYHTGGTPPTSNPRFFDGKNVWVCIGDINSNKTVSDSSIYLTDEAIDVANIPLTVKGSLLYSFKLSIGKVAFADKNLYTNEAIISIPPQKNINLRYYYYMLPIFLYLSATENIYGAKMLNQKIISNALVINPPYDIQNEIADYLDSRIDSLSDVLIKIEEKLTYLERLKTNLIENVIKGTIVTKN